MSEIWSKLQALMAREGISKSDLAKIAGVTPSAVTSWSHGGHISPAIAKKLSEHFGVDLTGLISNLIPLKAAKMVAETRERYGGESGSLSEMAVEMRRLSDRMSAIEQLLIRVLAEREKSKKGD